MIRRQITLRRVCTRCRSEGRPVLGAKPLCLKEPRSVPCAQSRLHGAWGLLCGDTDHGEAEGQTTARD